MTGIQESFSDLDVRAYRNALGRFATGVCVVTAQMGQGERIGMTVNSFSSVSLSPPLILFSIATAAKGIGSWRTAQTYAVNVLAYNQQDISNRFARSLSDKRQGLDIESGPYSTPLIPGAIARFECRGEHQYSGGDHIIFVGRVLSFDVPRPDAEPLIFHAGRYRELTNQHDNRVPADALWLLGWCLSSQERGHWEFRNDQEWDAAHRKPARRTDCLY